MSTDANADEEASSEADTYELLEEHDIDDEPPAYRPIGPGDVFLEIGLDHLADPVTGPVMVVGHPCSLRRGLTLQPDIPVAPIGPPGIPTAQQPHADRVLPVAKLLPPQSTTNQVVHLTRTTTVPADRLDIGRRCAALNRAGIVALQQRVVGNQTRVKIVPAVIAAHCRGPLTEIELWTDWRERAGMEAGMDAAFAGFMDGASGFGTLSWRDALGAREDARARAVVAMTKLLDELLG